MVVPVIVGVGRVTEKRPERLEDASDPIDLAKVSMERALSDASLSSNDCIDAIMFVSMLGEDRLPRRTPRAYKNPAYTLAKRSGIDARSFFLTTVGGNGPQFCVNDASERISCGEFDSVLITGAEAIDTLERALKGKYELSETKETSTPGKVLKWGDRQTPEPVEIGLHEKILTLQDVLHDMNSMPNAYAILEQELQRKDQVSQKERRLSNAKLFSGLSKVAAENPEHSWFPKERSIEEIFDVNANNRHVAYPYSKLNCSIMNVNMAASILVMSTEKAKSLGIPEDKWVYLHGCADCPDPAPRHSERADFSRCLGMKIVADATFKSANIQPSQLDFFEIYSCFPVAVRTACREMGIDKYVDIEKESSSLSRIGGLPFHGGPGNNYVAHGIVGMIETLRENPNGFGLVTANGGVLSKHSCGVYSCVPYSETHSAHPTQWVRPNCQQALKEAREEFPARKLPINVGDCNGIIKNYTISYKAHEKPSKVICYGDITSGPFTGDRFLAISQDEKLLQQFTSRPEGFFDRPVKLTTKDINGKGKAFATTFSLVENSSNL